MTYRTPAVLKTFFEEGDVPTEAQFGDLIDSTHPQVKEVIAPSGSDDSAIIQTAFDASVAGDVYEFTPGTFLVSTQIDLPDTHSISIIGAGIDVTTFQATAAMTSVFHKASTTEIQRPSFEGFTIDCDRLADRGITYGASNEALFERLRVDRPLTHGIYLGDGATAGSRGGLFSKILIDGDVNITVARTDYGVYCDTLSADNKFSQCVVKYVGDTGFHFIGTSNTITNSCHIFGGATKCVRASANTLVEDSFLDSPTDVGVEVNAVGVIILGNRFFNNTGGAFYDASAVGIRLVGGARNPVVLGNFFRFLDREIDYGSAFAKPGLSWGNSSSDIITGTDIALNFLTDDMVIKGDNDAEARALIIRTQAGQEARLLLHTLGDRRWQIYKNNTAESGSNAGAHLSINRYSDANAFLGTPIQIRRDTGETRLLEGLRVTGDLGVNGTTPVAKGTVTGSRGGNAALASLLTYLASRGDITDNSS